MEMDEIQLVRDTLADLPGSDDAILRRARTRLSEEFTSSTGLPAVTQNNAVIRFPNRYRWPIFVSGIMIAATLLLVGLLPTTNGYSDLGLEVSAASTLPITTHAYDKALSFTYLPSGLSRGDTSLRNKTTNPSQFVLSVSLANAAARAEQERGFEVLDVSVQQGNVLTPSSGANATEVNVNGHVGKMTVIAPRPLRQSAPAAGCGVVAKVSLNALGVVILSWQERPGVMLELVGFGISGAEVLKVARGIVFHQSFDDCFSDGRIVSSVGACAPGISESGLSEMSVRPNTEIGGGTLDGSNWNVSAAVEPSYDWVYFQFGNELVSGQCVTGKSFAPELEVRTTITGKRFATGWVPSFITSVRATSPGGSTVTVPVLPVKLGSAAFFFLYLGQNKGLCDQLCSGKATVAFYRGSKETATVAVSSDTSISGFPVPGRTTVPASKLRSVSSTH
jgi:hypothetical protein